MGGGYKDYYEGYPNYRHHRLTYPLARFYSGSTATGIDRTLDKSTYFIASYVIVIGQIDNNIYISSNSIGPIKYYNKQQGKETTYENYIQVEDIDAILDYLPESWYIYATNILYNISNCKVNCYNHDTLVADGIEQS